MPSQSLTFRLVNDPSNRVEVKELCVRREVEAGLAFLTSEDIPDLFVATTDGEEIRVALDKALKNAFGEHAERVQVFTNGKIDGPDIDVMVKVTR